jgi:hypothetical protein
MREDMSDDFEQEAYEVGYQKPPRNRQFKRGVSGNPSGRPKKSRTFSSQVMRELKSRLTVTENGKRKVITKDEAVAKQMVNKAASGNLQAARLVIDLRGQELESQAEEERLAKRSLRELTNEELMAIVAGGKEKLADGGD